MGKLWGDFCEYFGELEKCVITASHCLSYLTTLNSLWPIDAIWQHRSGSTLAQVMACCLTASNHYLNQYWPHYNGIWLYQAEGGCVYHIYTISQHYSRNINHGCAEVFWEHIQIFLHYLSFLNTEMAPVIETHPHGKQEPSCPTSSIPWLLIWWQCKQVSFKKEVGVRVNYMVIRLMMRWSVDILPICLIKWCI